MVDHVWLTDSQALGYTDSGNNRGVTRFLPRGKNAKYHYK